jgi:DNA-binding NarL/FixJ family response regulator
MVALDLCRVLLVDDQEPVRSSLRAFLEIFPKWQVCGEAIDGEQGAREAARLAPDLIIMDVAMPRMDGIQSTREIRKVLPQTPILILSFHDSPHMVSASFRAGATGYLLKARLGRELIPALETVSRHERFLSAGLREPN